MQTMPETPKRGRPATHKAMTATERQRASRAERKRQTFESFPAMHLSLLLSGQAYQALRMLAIKRDTSQKEIIEKLLIDAYAESKA
ncbi:MAG: hypothetical protein Q8P42_02980 [Gallionella sp.]|nr:hypothetical protein [Gallionella sp.]